MKKNEIAKNLSAIKKEIKKAQLVAVTKYSPIEDVIAAYEAHHYDFGENRVQDLSEKARAFFDLGLNKVKWHFIGHLQTNKVRDLLKIPNLYAIHSVDSVKLLEELIKRESDFSGPELKIFFQVNTSREEEKSGFETAEELDLAINLLLGRAHSKLKFFGLMTMGTIRTDDFETEATRCFKDLNVIARNIEKTHQLKNKLKLSMGMSQDYKLALAEGSDFIRVGSAIFKAH
ncbi:MAG: YggS family pyridoxal phosphate-dependent enzyme [Bacteriovorax sp.]